MSVAYKILFFGFLGIWALGVHPPKKAKEKHVTLQQVVLPAKKQCTSLLTAERPDSTWWETLCTGGAKPWDSTSWVAPRPEP